MNLTEFIGQDAIKTELMNTIGHHVHILFRGPSGCGKTQLAELFAGLMGKYDMQTVQTAEEISFNPLAVTHVVDEIHLLRRPEVLFDEMTRTRFIFCTTEGGDLLETLLNRCIVLTFRPYTLVEIMQIGWTRYEFDPAVMALIASRSRDTPRVMLQTCQRVLMSVPNPSYYEVKQFLEHVGVYDLGYTDEDMQYLEVLSNLGIAGRDTLAAAIHVPATTITRVIEPFLLRQGRIRITPRGRVLV